MAAREGSKNVGERWKAVGMVKKGAGQTKKAPGSSRKMSGNLRGRAGWSEQVTDVSWTRRIRAGGGQGSLTIEGRQGDGTRGRPPGVLYPWRSAPEALDLRPEPGNLRFGGVGAPPLRLGTPPFGRGALLSGFPGLGLFQGAQQRGARGGLEDLDGTAGHGWSEKEARGLGEDATLGIRRDRPVEPIRAETMAADEEAPLRVGGRRVEDEVFRNPRPLVDPDLLVVVVVPGLLVRGGDELDHQPGAGPLRHDVEALAVGLAVAHARDHRDVRRRVLKPRNPPEHLEVAGHEDV